ncbi:MAG TPA: hypothetical protein VFN56_02840 [Candidatus Saccharimonadales bacterium]|nr:hypothetical protein [Candidatus Saccharimonadales bacterium]
MAEQLIDSSTLLPERAVVLGCGMAGIAAAAALSNHFEEVLVVERDAIPQKPEPRRGVPQHAQLHNLLSCAQFNLEHLIPGFIAGLQEAGAGNASVADETHVYELGIKMPERDLGLRLMSAWRPVIEHVARQRLIDEGKVAFEGLGRAIGLTKQGDRLNGVLVEQDGKIRAVGATVVVDATGSGSNAPRWLAAVDEQVPVNKTTQAGQWYVSTIFERPSDYAESNDFWLTFPSPPNTRGGLISPIGNNQWYVSLSGRLVDQPPKTVDEVKAYAATLEDNLSIASLIEHARPATTPNLFRKTTATMRRYDLLDKPLAGFLPVGDTIASLNPLFGQGMSVASQQARELDDTLMGYRAGTDDITELTTSYLERAVAASQSAWELGEVVDQTVSGSADTESVGLRYKALAELIKEDPKLHRLYVGIWHLIEPASALQEPSIQERLDSVAAKLATKHS